MPHEKIQLDLVMQKLEARLYYLEKYQPGSLPFTLEFLHKVRHPQIRAQYPDWHTSDEAYQYYKTLPQALEAFRAELKDVDADLVLTPPSHREDAVPYLAAVKYGRQNILDLTTYIGKLKATRAGQLRAEENLIRHIALSYPSRLGKY